MIIDQKHCPDDPPSYDELIGALPAPPTEKLPLDPIPGQPSSSTSPALLNLPRLDTTSTSLSSTSTSASPFPPVSHPRPSSSTKTQIQTTVQQLLRTLVTHHLTDSDPLAAQGLLDSCVTACGTYGLSLSSLLQLRYVETHSPIYWALVKRPGSPALAELLFELSKPFGENAVKELRDGCLVNSDHRFFRMFLARGACAGTGEGGTADEEAVQVLLDEEGDVVDVDGVAGDDAAFCVHMALASFQKRMVVRGQVRVEFVAKGRLFRLLFHKSENENTPAESGSWLVSLFILGASPSTFIDSRLIIPDPSTYAPAPPAPNSASSSSPPQTQLIATIPSPESTAPLIPESSSTSTTPTQATTSFTSSPLSFLDASFKNAYKSTTTSTHPFSSSTANANPKPTISLRLRSPSHQPLIALPPEPTTRSQKRRWGEVKKTHGIEVSLEQGSLMGASLTYSGTSYLAADGKLRARLEAKLGKPESDCVIC